MITLFAGEIDQFEKPWPGITNEQFKRGGTSGCVVAGRLAENPEIRVLLIEAGQHNKDLENVHMTGG